MAAELSVEELRRIPAFADLSEAQLQWFLDRCELLTYEAGDYLSHAGDPATHMTIILEGNIQVRSDRPDGPFFTLHAGAISGVLPFSRMTAYPNPSRATAHTRVLRFPKQDFSALYQELPELIPRLVGILTDRVREVARQTTQTEKLAAIGKLSAGLAHELNNPAAAARQATTSAQNLFACYRETLDELAVKCASAEIYEQVRALEARATQAVASPPVMDSLTRNDLEESIAEWFRSIGVEESWRCAPAYVDAGFNLQSLQEAVSAWPPDIRELAIYRVSSSIEMAQVLTQMDHATKRISDLVSAMKSYSFMDRTSLAEFDLNQSLETTLTLFSFRTKHGFQVVKEYDCKLPKICAHGGQLNQVWTNLIDNALDAMESDKHRKSPSILRITTRLEVDYAVVEIADNGPGIPVELQGRIFDPFFTTKDQGEGTGLGLDTVYHIVKQHNGDIRFTSSEEGTSFCIRLPLHP